MGSILTRYVGKHPAHTINHGKERFSWKKGDERVIPHGLFAYLMQHDSQSFEAVQNEEVLVSLRVAENKVKALKAEVIALKKKLGVDVEPYTYPDFGLPEAGAPQPEVMNPVPTPEDVVAKPEKQKAKRPSRAKSASKGGSHG